MKQRTKKARMRKGQNNLLELKTSEGGEERERVNVFVCI